LSAFSVSSADENVRCRVKDLSDELKSQIKGLTLNHQTHMYICPQYGPVRMHTLHTAVATVKQITALQNISITLCS